ncbi:hypothetical protein TanjilG_30895 [Lupinus angustifolius]|uniref:Uncharacterized protein n=1 Tax=Lupinus angustifolius TaxID=3871 RepID=A0A1J7FVS1_LUPAN|nr:hypothetical protein TanjilG_30895 [Lupinus angustifolius]
MTLCSNAKYSNWWRMLWFTVVWSVWLMRNEVVFRDTEFSVLNVLNSIKIRS